MGFDRSKVIVAGVSKFAAVAGLAVVAALSVPVPAAGQSRRGPPAAPSASVSASGRDTARVVFLDGLNVTATRTARPVFETPAPVVVLGPERIRSAMPSNLADLFRSVPGMDAEGVGPGQRRPVIRGMRGQRVLLLEDGLRLNNVRRRVDSGESTSLVWMGAVYRIEVVRGPASVLNGSDAVGGVINLITRAPSPGAPGSLVSGALEAGRRSAGTARTLSGEVTAGVGALALRVSGGYRSAGAYHAPAGAFGALRLDRPREVHDSDLTDRSLRLEAAYRLERAGELFVRREAYRSENSGFGWLDPEVFGPASVKTRLLWPKQEFDRTTVGYRGASPVRALADHLSASAYLQSNARWFTTEIHAPVPGAAPDAAVDVRSDNYTDLDSRGLRLEARKLLTGRALLTYGFDAYEDRAQGTDTSTTTVRGLGPTRVSGRGGPQVPDAHLTNVGFFSQVELEPWKGGRAVVGLRYQDVISRTSSTRGNPAEPARYHDRTVVGAANLLQRVGTRVNVVASLARGFRTPNLVERFFVGPTPSGRGFWEPNAALHPEVSLSVEVGVRYRGPRLRAEGFVFRNVLRGGIVLEPTGRREDRVTYYRNVNVDELRYRGVEMAAAAELGGGFGLEAEWSALDVADARDPARVFVETYPSRLGGALRYRDASGRVEIRYHVRHNGSRTAPEGATPVGDRIPSFTVHDVRAEVRLLGRHHLGVAVENLTDALYAEALNTGFFRPEPGRTLALTWGVTF